MSLPNDDMKASAKIGEDVCAAMIAEQLPSEAYYEYERLKDSINMHVGMPAAQRNLPSLIIFQAENL